MKKRLIVRSLIGLAVGSLLAHIITILIIYFSRGEYLFCMPELTEKLGSVGAVALQTVLGAIFGMVAFGGMCFFDIEKWSLLRATVAHCSMILVTYIVVGLLLHWLPFKIEPILFMVGIIIVVYALIWLIMYIVWKIEIRQMNRLAEEYKKNTEIDED
ncbi:MAG: DUF3021 domain-containing protein [Saccharofermentanales bacterium]|jgi:hypothetical protein